MSKYWFIAAAILASVLVIALRSLGGRGRETEGWHKEAVIGRNMAAAILFAFLAVVMAAIMFSSWQTIELADGRLTLTKHTYWGAVEKSETLGAKEIAYVKVEREFRGGRVMWTKRCLAFIGVDGGVAYRTDGSMWSAEEYAGQIMAALYLPGRSFSSHSFLYLMPYGGLLAVFAFLAFACARGSGLG